MTVLGGAEEVAKRNLSSTSNLENAILDPYMNFFALECFSAKPNSNAVRGEFRQYVHRNEEDGAGWFLHPLKAMVCTTIKDGTEPVSN